MSTVDEESMETWVEDLRGEVARLKAEVDLMRRIVVLPLEQTRDEVKALEPGNTAAACRAIDLWNMRSNTEAKCRENRELRASRDSCVGSYKACRNVMKAAGVPCNFGRDGEPTTDEGMGRDLADCVKSLVERMQTAEASLAALAAENQSLREQGRAVEADNARLIARVNYFVCKAPLKDVTWRPTR